MDPESGDLPPDDRPGLPAGAVEVGGVQLTMDSTLRALKAACASLNVSQNGSKKQLLQRLLKVVQESALIAQERARASVQQEMSRPPVVQPDSRLAGMGQASAFCL